MRNAVRQAILAAFAGLTLAPVLPAFAGPADQVFPAVVEAGEREIELRAGTAKLRDGSRVSEEILTIGYGVNSHWFTELGAQWHQQSGGPNGFDAWEWENRF